MVTPVISLDKSLNGYLGITDITTYSAGQRDLTGIMEFWSNDAFAADVSLDQSNADQWTVPAVAQDTYNVYSFYCYTWDVLNDVDIAQGDIVFYQGYFYIKTTAGTKNPFDGDANPNLDTTDFTPLYVGGIYNANPLTAADIYALAVGAVALADGNSTDTTSVTFIDQASFVLTKQACEKWLVQININCTIYSADLINYDGTVLIAGIVPVGNTIPIDLTAYGDGSYTIQIVYSVPAGRSPALTVTIPILEVCNANACYTKLFKYTLCKCDDPCDDCEDHKAKRHDMQIIRELVTSINQMVNLERSQFMGLYPITTSQSDLLSDIGMAIDKLKIVTDRCGLCGSDTTLDVTC
jgi:hypothetical protein